jgi:phosphatidylinositol alpha-1,6-mannosyltransferase
VTFQYPYQNALYRAVAKKIVDFQPDIVHALHIREWAGLVAAREWDIPTVLTTHALELEERTLARQAVSATDIIQPVSKFTASLVDDIDPMIEKRVIHPSINVSAYHDVAARIDDKLTDGPVVTVTRLVERKNVDTLVEAWRLLDDNLTDERELVIVGEGPEREAIEQLAANCSDIRLTGWITEDQKRELLARASVFVLIPNRIGFDVEGFGIAYIEAQAAGTPVIGSKHGGVPEAIGDAGIVVDNENDPKNVANAIMKMLRNAEIRETYERNAADRIDQFSIPTITKKHITLYKDLLE